MMTQRPPSINQVAKEPMPIEVQLEVANRRVALVSNQAQQFLESATAWEQYATLVESKLRETLKHRAAIEKDGGKDLVAAIIGSIGEVAEAATPEPTPIHKPA